MKKYIYVIVAIVLIFVGYYAVNAIFTPDYEIPVAKADFGEFVIALNTNGTVDAKRAFTLSAPRMRGLQITWMAPEGSTVKEGDPVIRFDASEQLADLADQESELKIKEAALERARKEYTIQEKQLTLDLEKARRNYLEMQHEAPRIAEEAKLEMELAELNFDAKLEQLKADVNKAEVEVRRAKDRRDQSQRELDQMTINAPIPGLVVYLEIWKGSGMSKVQEGDSPWPGMGLIKLPDLGEMIIKTAVSEVDASKVDSAQEVMITVDAFPDKTYHGIVVNKGALARKKDQNSEVNVFDVEVAVLDHDEGLKPGMSASARIVIDRLKDVVSVPMEAVFEREGRTVVYLKNKHEHEVEVGRRNEMAVQIVSGLEPGEEICLVDPTLEEQGLPGDKATEPELNQGRTQPSSGGGRGRRSGR
ncbi:MAG TPA: efflux RND transporter periplasmic adaptor subunit [candidate division Zixibacteria bacterium]|nr:efflux RND transporter periplasmic adaptor subunit [candidate division Zixibacteria bacterium]